MSRLFLLGLTVSLLIVLAVAGVTTAQNIQNPQSAVDNSMRSNLHVDESTGAMQLQIPLGVYRGRGEASLPISLSYSSKLWTIKHQVTQPCNHEPWSTYFTEYAKGSASGWTSTVGWFLPTEDSAMESYEGATQQPATVGNPSLYRIMRKFVTLPDGSRHELRRDDSLHSFGDNQSGTYYAVDGSRLRWEWTDSGTNTLYLPNGSRIVAGNGSRQYIDRNGNLLAFDGNSSTWSDTLGRSIGVPVPGTTPAAGDYTYTLPGGLTYTLRWRNLSDALTTADTLRYRGDSSPPINCSAGVYQPNHLFSSVDGQKRVRADSIFNPVVLWQISLPNGTAYTFTYNVYGEMNKIVYPTGGSETFSYDVKEPLGGQLDDGTFAQANRGVTSRVVNDGIATQSWGYGYGLLGGTGVDPATAPRSVVAPNGTSTVTWYYKSRGADIKYGFDDARTGMAREERVYNSSGTMLRRTVYQLAYDYSLSSGYLTTRNARVKKKVDIILDTGGPNALAAITEMDYDADLNVISTKHYDYVSISQSAAQNGDIPATYGDLLRTEETTFLVNDPNIDASIRDAYRASNLLSLPTSTRVRDGNDDLMAQSSISYDETSLQNIGNTNGWIDPQNDHRGNPTSAASWLNTTNTYLTTQAQYDQFGNVRSATDANGNQSQLDYSAAYSYAYPTTATSAVPDPSGLHGSTTAFVTSTAFDGNTGLVTSTTDANNVTTNFEYADPLNRLTRTVRAAGTGVQSQTTIYYDDINRIVTTTSDQSAFGDNLLKSETVYDSLGRTTESRQYESATAYITVKQTYDAMGRVNTVSNPYRAGESIVWTTTQFDALSRAISVTMPGNAVVTTGYSGNRALVADQAGKERISLTDGLGRLKDIWEVTAADSATEVISFPNHADVTAYHTNYQYDTLDNLTTVTQGAQAPRTFTYDSLKRLTSATNPESGAVSYTYDNNSNLLTKTDAREIVSAYSYDALNRNTGVVYTNDPAQTPAVMRTYDGATNGKGRIWRTATTGDAASRTTIDGYDALGRTLTQRQQFYSNDEWSSDYTVSASYDRAGHVVGETYPSGRAVAYAYDAAGRTTEFSGRLGTSSAIRIYATGMIYDPSGRMIQERLGTDTPLYHKLGHNSRGQLSEIRVSTVAGDASWNRGKIINDYSSQCSGALCNGSENNGNLIKQTVFVPHDEQSASSTSWQQQYSYDSLNRLTRVHEDTGNTATDWQQSYQYDRWGNRTIDADQTSGVGINALQVAINPSNNRLNAPADPNHDVIDYDDAGNQTKDYLSWNGTRAYDAENRMTSATDGDEQTSTYTYDGDGRRVIRNVNGTETWQVYGISGELLAEYQPAADPATPNTEYGYRNGELLVKTEEAFHDQGPLQLGSYFNVPNVPNIPNIPHVDPGPGPTWVAALQWLVTDQLGTPRMIFDNSGTLSNVKRHDYLPFGEEVFAGTGGRTTAQGYSADSVRQKFTSKERDSETGLDYFIARYYSSTQGRFESPDPLSTSGHPSIPQSWNRYPYVLNNPLKLIDPDGEMWVWHYLDKAQTRVGVGWIDGNKIPKDLQAKGYQALDFGGAKTKDVGLTDGSVVRLSATSGHPEVLSGPTGGGARSYVNAGLINELGRQTAPIPKATAMFMLFSANGGFAIAGSSIAALDAAAYALYAVKATNDQDAEAQMLATTQSQYVEKTQGGIRTVETNVSKGEFIKNLVDDGYSMSRSGNATILEKGGVRYSVYDVSRSTGGPSAARSVAGEQQMKVRLKP